MRNAETVLGIIRNRGSRGLPVDDLYHQPWNPNLYLMAYGRIASNDDALTPGATPETADGMTKEKIDAIIEALRFERIDGLRPAAHISRKPTGNGGHSDSQRGRTNCCKRCYASSWGRTTSRSSATGHTASDPTVAATRPSRKSLAPGRAPPGSSTVTLRAASTTSTTRCCWTSCARTSGTTVSYG